MSSRNQTSSFTNHKIKFPQTITFSLLNTFKYSYACYIKIVSSRNQTISSLHEKSIELEITNIRYDNSFQQLSLLLPLPYTPLSFFQRSISPFADIHNHFANPARGRVVEAQRSPRLTLSPLNRGQVHKDNTRPGGGNSTRPRRVITYANGGDCTHTLACRASDTSNA